MSRLQLGCNEDSLEAQGVHEKDSMSHHGRKKDHSRVSQNSGSFQDLKAWCDNWYRDLDKTYYYVRKVPTEIESPLPGLRSRSFSSCQIRRHCLGTLFG